MPPAAVSLAFQDKKSLLSVQRFFLMRLLFNIFKHSFLGYVPSAFIVQTDGAGQMTYTLGKVYAHTLESYSVPLDDRSKKLFDIVEACSEEALENKYNAPGKRKKTLVKLWEDEQVRSSMVAYLERQLDLLFRLLREDGAPLGLDLYRKAFVSDHLVRFADGAPQPNLFFKKTPEGIFYQLRFQEVEGRIWRIAERPSVVLANSPAWVLFDRTVYQLPEINGNMIKPFQKQDEVFVAERFVADYFKKFVVRVAAKAEIEAEGFQVVVSNQLDRAELHLVEDPFRQVSGLSLSFAYGKEKFPFFPKNPSRTRLHFGEDGTVSILQIRRDEAAEQQWAERLVAFGLEQDIQGLFVSTAFEHPLDGAVYLSEHRKGLEEQGFTVAEPVIDNRRICLERSEHQLEFFQDGDWFDVRGRVCVGDKSVPFVELAPYIRSGNRFFPIGEELFWIIPPEWMQRFGPFFQLAQTSTGRARITKSQYTLLEDLPIPRAPAREERPFAMPAELEAVLRPYQMEGLKWLFGLYSDGLGGCLADDMGLGKTLQSIGMLLIAHREKTLREADSVERSKRSTEQMNLFAEFVASRGGVPPLNALVVLPASLVFNWRAELARFAPSLQVYVHTGTKRMRSELPLRGFDVILTTYQTLLKDVAFLQKIDFEYMVLDEAQQIKNKDSKLFSAVNDIRARNKLSLSGTPIENSLSELWAQMQFINPGLLGSYPHFKRHYQLPIEKQRDPESIQSLRRLIAPFLLRRTKAAVEKDLPELTRQVYFSEMGEAQRKRYEREKSAVRNYILEHFRAGDGPFRIQVFSALTRLRQLANHPALLKEHPVFDSVIGPGEEEEAPIIDSGKFDDIVHHLDVINRSGQKALLFSQFVRHLELFGEWLTANGIPYVTLTGEHRPEQRERAVHEFENRPDLPFFLISLKAGGSGLNLTAADYVLIADPWWNPAAEEQAIARAHRIGQTKKVVAIKFIAKDSIEEKIVALQDKKRQIAADFVDQQGNLPMEKEDLVYLVS